MIRLVLTSLSFPLALFTGVSLFGWTWGVVVAVVVTNVVAFAAYDIWPARRVNPVKIEPRLRPIAPPRFETPEPVDVRDVPTEGRLIIENNSWHGFPVDLSLLVPETLQALLAAEVPTSPIIEIHPDGSIETLRDLAARVTPELLALPIPTEVRTLLMDLLEATK